jgi:hypothetical protein
MGCCPTNTDESGSGEQAEMIKIDRDISVIFAAKKLKPPKT